MKQTFILACVAALLLCGCAAEPPIADTSGSTTSSITTSAESKPDSTAPPTTTTTAPQPNLPPDEEARKHATLFLQAMQNKDADVLFGYRVPQKAAQELAEGMTLKGFTIADAPKQEGEAYIFPVRLEISESTLDMFSNGESDWLLTVGPDMSGKPITLQKPGANHIVTFNKNNSATNFAYLIAVNLSLFLTIDSLGDHLEEGDIDTHYIGLPRLCSLYYTPDDSNQNGFYPVETMNRMAWELFGAKGLDWTASRAYHADSQTIATTFYGGLWYYATEDALKTVGNRTTVDLTFYADGCSILPALSMRYELEKQETTVGWRMLSCEKRGDTGREMCYGTT